MSNQLEKLKHSIKKEYVNNFELNLMKSSGFIPVDKRQSDFFVILNKENSAGRAEIIQLIKKSIKILHLSLFQFLDEILMKFSIVLQL